MEKYAEEKIASNKNMKGINNFRNKICHFTIVHQPFDTRIFHKEIKTLSKAGYDVTLIAQNDKNETIDGVQFIALQKAKNRIYRISCSTFKIFLLALKQNADIYHFHDPELLPVGVLLMACQRPIVATWVGGIPEIVEDKVSGLLIPPKNVASLVKAISELLEDRKGEERWANMGDRLSSRDLHGKKSPKKPLIFIKIQFLK